MFHIWQVGTTLPQGTETMSALYTVALPSEVSASFGGIRPQGQYPASPLTAPSACASDAKRLVEPTDWVNSLTETIAVVPQGMTQSNDRLGILAGRTGSVAHLIAGVSLRGNDGKMIADSTTAMGAYSAKRNSQG